MQKPKKAAKTTSKPKTMTAAALFHAGHASTKTIAASKIYALFIAVLGRPIRLPSDPVGDYIQGGPGAVPAFANKLNTSPQFRPYGLDLVPGDVANVQTIGQLGGAVVRNFQENGWTVTPN